MGKLRIKDTPLWQLEGCLEWLESHNITNQLKQNGKTKCWTLEYDNLSPEQYNAMMDYAEHWKQLNQDWYTDE